MAVLFYQTTDKGLRKRVLDPFMFTKEKKWYNIREKRKPGEQKMYNEKNGKQMRLEMVIIEELSNLDD